MLFPWFPIHGQGPGGVGNADGSDGQPRQIMWFDAGTLILNNGDRVATWNDISGNSHDAIQSSTANRPFFVSNIITNHPVIRFDPNYQTFLPFPGELLVGTDLTVIMVTARRSSTGIDDNRKMVIGGTGTSGNQNLHMGWRDQNNFMANHWSNDIVSSMTGGAGSGINDFGIFTNRLSSTEVSPQRRLFQNNLQIGSINNSNFLSSYPGAAMGKRTSDNYYDVDIAEIIFFDEALSLPALSILHNHLAAKYQLPLDTGQLYTDASYIHNLIGIGTHDGQIKHSRSSGNGGALYLAEANNSLNQTNEFVFAAHNNTSHGVSSTQIPQNVTDRWTRDYHIYRTQGGQQGDGNTDVRIGFDFLEAGIPATDNFYYLLYRSNTLSDFTIVPGPGAIASVSEAKAWFTLSSNNFLTGVYTIGRTEQSATTWYAYKDGNWSDPDTWTTDPGGQILIPQGSTDIPGPLDRVVVLSPRIVTVDMDSIQVQALEVRSGSIIDFQATSGNSMGSISGEGLIRLRADNFPAGDATAFAAANGSTVEYYGSVDISLSTARSFRNMVVNLSSSDNLLTLLADYTLQGNLTVVRGNLRINNNEATQILTINVQKNLDIYPSGRLSTGTGNTIGSYSLPGSMPPTGQYHQIFHQLRIGGDMHVASGAQAHFSNLDNPVYNTFATNGAVTVTFYGSSHNILQLEDRANFYNLIIDKGNDQTYTLEVNSSNRSHFNLFGPNTAGRVIASPFSMANPEVRKSLWVRNGTLKLTGSIHIPSLTEGNQAGGNGDYPIGANASLWIAGPDVRIYTTLSNAANTPEFNPNGGTGYNNNSDNTALSLAGKFRIDNGFFGTRQSAGFIFWGDATATVEINGGIVDVAQFRSTLEGTGARTSYIQTGGHLRIRAGVEYWGEPLGGEVTGNYPIFSINDPSGVFNMSGGEITILASSSNSDGNIYGNNGFYVLSSDFNVSGGTLNIHLNGSDNSFFIETTANLWNLNITCRNTSNRARVRFTRELTVANDLNIGNISTLHPRRADGGTQHDLHIGRNFVLATSADYTSFYGGDGNTTYFTGPNDGQIVLAKTEGTAVTFHRMVVDKNSHDATLQLVSEGREIVNITDPDIDFVNLESPVEIRNALIVKRGVLDYNGFPLFIGGDVTIENQSSIGIIGEPGFLLISVVGSQQQQIITPLNTQPVFGNLLIDNTGLGVMLHGGATVTIGNLGLRNGIFDIGSQGIIVEKDIINISHSLAPDFSANKLIKTAGSHGDGGVTRRIRENGTYLFPIGTMNHNNTTLRYAWAEPTLTNVPQVGGYIQINGVPGKLPTLGESNPDEFLRYYWRIRHDGFSSEPNIHNKFNSFQDDYVTTVDNYEVGKVVNLNRYGHNNPDPLGSIISAENNTRILDYSFIYPIESGEFTAAISSYFTGEITVYYSYLPGGHNWYDRSWSDNSFWSTVPHGEPNRSSGVGIENAYPQTGDIAVIGYGDYAVGGSHSLIINNFDVECAEIRFNSFGDAAVSRLVVYHGRTLNAGLVTGNGTFMIRPTTTSWPNIQADFSDFINTDVSIFNYYLNDNGSYTIPSEMVNHHYPNLRIEGGSNIIGAKNATIVNNFLVRGDFQIDGDVEFITHDGSTGDFTVLGEFRLGGYLGGTLSFNDKVNPRTITVGAIRFFGNNDPSRRRQIRVLNLVESSLKHRLIVKGNIYRNAGVNNRLDFFTNNIAGNNIILEFSGENNSVFEEILSPTNWNESQYPNLYRIVIRKDFPENEVLLNGRIKLEGAADQSVKPLTLETGTFIINNAANVINLTTGGPNYKIPRTASIISRNGWAQIPTGTHDSHLELDGLLRFENFGAIVLYSNIQYSSSGNARLELVGDPQVWVAGQIHSSINNESGVLKYKQTGGNIYIANNFSDIPNRGVLEIRNPGSIFEFTGGEITLTQGQSGTPTMAALHLNPSQYTVSSDAVINIGKEDWAMGAIVEINSHIPLPNINVTAADVHARLRTNALSLTGNLIISEGNSFSAQNMNLTIKGNLTNLGTPNLETDTLFLNGDTQILKGEMVFNHLVVEPQNSVALEEANSNIIVNANLHVNTGTFYDGGNTISVQKDVYNFATLHTTNTTSGGLRLTGVESQRLFGNGTFGRLEIDKTAGEVSLEGSLAMENNLALTNGRLNLRHHRLTLGYNSEILLPPGEDFGPSRMIYTDGLYSDGGLAKRIPAGSGGFTFPLGIGSPQKYTPVTLTYTTNTNPGLVAISPNNSRHMTIPVVNTDVLQYHWWVTTRDLNNFSGTIRFDYDAGDVVGDAAEYIPAFLWDDPENPDFGWAKYIEEWVNQNENYFFVEFDGVSSFRGDFTAGRSVHIPDNVPLFVSTNNGSWTESANWQHAITGEPAPIGGPTGFRVRIEPADTITTNNNRISYRTQILGALNIGSTYGHNMGRISGNGTLMLEGSQLPAGNFDEFFGTQGSTMIYGGEGIDYNITDRYTTLQNLQLKGSGDRTLPNNDGFTINGNWLSQDDVYIRQQNDIRVNGDIEWRDSVYLLTSHGHNIDFYGVNITKSHDARYSAEKNNSLRLYGSHDKSISGAFNSVSNRFNNMYIYNGANVYLNGDINLRTYLGLYHSSRVVVMPDFTLTLDRSDPLESVSPGSYVQGILSRNLSAGSNHRFPLGHEGNIREVFLHEVSLSGYYTAQYLTGMVFDTGAMDEQLEAVSDTEYWTLDAPSGSTAKVQLSWGPGSSIPEVDPHLLEEYMAVAEWNNEKWINKGNSAAHANGDMTGWVVASDATEFFNKSSGRYLTLASTNTEQVPLPIELLSFTAELQEDRVELEWVTASETNNNFFTIERSRDGKKFEVITVTSSQAENGNSYQTLYYSAPDTQPLEGINYYRLKQTDYDGSFEYSDLIVVMYKKMADVVFNLYPNPNKGNAFHIALNGLLAYESLEVNITSLQGGRVYHNLVSANDAGFLNSHIVPSGTMTAGVYLVTVSGTSGNFVVRMMVN